MKSKLVSVIIPVYNCENYISECLESILSQTYSNIEVIIVDDGSTDNTKNIIFKSYISKIRYFYQNNSGAPAARNKGLEKANGEYIIFFDADDRMDNKMIEFMVYSCELDNSQLVISNFGLIDERGDYIKKNTYEITKRKKYKIDEFKKKVHNISPFPDNKLYMKKIIDKHHIFFDDVRIGQDLNFFLKYISNVRIVSVIPQRLCDYRILPMSITRNYDERVVDIILSIKKIEEYIKRNNKLDYLKKMINTEKLLHTYYQLSKCQKIKDRKLKRKIANYFFKENIENLLKPEKTYFGLVPTKIKFLIKYILVYLNS